MARWIESYARDAADHEVWIAEDERGVGLGMELTRSRCTFTRRI